MGLFKKRKKLFSAVKRKLKLLKRLTKLKIKLPVKYVFRSKQFVRAFKN
jgi:hypothetical protein